MWLKAATFLTHVYLINLSVSTHHASSSLGLGLAWLWPGERGAREERPGLVTEAGGPDTEWMGRNVLGGALTTSSHYHHTGARQGLSLWENDDNDCTFYSPFNGFLRSLDGCNNVSSSHFLCARECLWE